VSYPDRLPALTRDYRIALLRYLPRRDEAALTAGYEWGREAVGSSVTLLDVVRVHHEVLREILETTPPEELVAVVDAASAFLTEVVAPFDLARQALLEEHLTRPQTSAGRGTASRDALGAGT
jgi:hypothetical protein